MTQAWQQAKEIAETLPLNAQWSFTVTELEDDAVFNIYAPLDTWHALCILLHITRKPDVQYRCCDGRFASYDEYTMDGLTLSFITPEEQDGSDEPAGNDPDGADHPAGAGPGGR